MRADEVRKGLEGVDDSALVWVWRDGMRVSTLRGAGHGQRPAYPPQVIRDFDDEEDEYPGGKIHPVKPEVPPSDWKYCQAKASVDTQEKYIVSGAATAGNSVIGHVIDKERVTYSWRVFLPTGECSHTFIHAVTACGVTMGFPLEDTQDRVFVEMPKGFRVCKLCVKHTGLPVCGYCGVPLKGRQTKWCSAHSSHHMRPEVD